MVVDWIINFPPIISRCLHTNSWNLWICNLTCERDFADMIKLKALRWKDYPSRLNVIMFLLRGKERKERVRWQGERFEYAKLLALKMEEETRNQGIQVPSRSWQRRQWQPTLVLLPGKSHGQGSLVGYSPWGHEELDTTERLHFHFSRPCIGEGNNHPLQCPCLDNPRDRGPGGLPSMGSHRVGHNWCDLAAAAARSWIRQGNRFSCSLWTEWSLFNTLSWGLLTSRTVK